MPKSEKEPSVLAKLNGAPKPAIKKSIDKTKAPRPSRNATRKEVPRYFVNPVFTPRAALREGGERMTVVIGPAQGQSTMYGSTPEANTPATMRTLLDNYPSFGWVAGHLLNDNLGGPGVALNLTPLTTAGNKNHLNAVEAQIKRSIDRAFSRTEFHKDDTHWYGVDYKVVVKDTPWPDMPVFVSTHLIVSAKVVRQHKTTLVVEDTPADDPCALSIYFSPISDVEVENTGFVAVPAVTTSASATASV